MRGRDVGVVAHVAAAAPVCVLARREHRDQLGLLRLGQRDLVIKFYLQHLQTRQAPVAPRHLQVIPQVHPDRLHVFRLVQSQQVLDVLFAHESLMHVITLIRVH